VALKLVVIIPRGMNTTLKAVTIGIAIAAELGTANGRRAQQRSVWDGVYAPGQANRGERLYANYCANCHGAELSGGDLAPALVGGEFSANWNGSTLGELFERIRTTMPQDSPESLNRQQYADIVAFILKKSDLPAGPSELSPEAAPLNAIRFVAARP
jgi:mono/diheme cytochrome c family protein